MADGKPGCSRWSKIFLVIDDNIIPKKLFQPVQEKDVDGYPDEKVRNRGLVFFPRSFDKKFHSATRCFHHLPGCEQEPLFNMGEKMENLMPYKGESDPCDMALLAAITAIPIM